MFDVGIHVFHGFPRSAKEQSSFPTTELDLAGDFTEFLCLSSKRLGENLTRRSLFSASGPEHQPRDASVAALLGWVKLMGY